MLGDDGVSTSGAGCFFLFVGSNALVRLIYQVRWRRSGMLHRDVMMWLAYVVLLGKARYGWV
jgi:hypothetical protein